MFVKVIKVMVAVCFLCCQQQASAFSLPFSSKSSSSHVNEKTEGISSHHRSLVIDPLFGWSNRMALDYFPFSTMQGMMEAMDRIDPWSNSVVAAPICQGAGVSVTGLCMEMSEHEKEYEVIVEMPGFNKDNLKLQIIDGELCMEAERLLRPRRGVATAPAPHPESTVSEQGESEAVEGKIMQPIKDTVPKQTLKRKFLLPDDADITGIEAELEDGVLSIVVPKKKPEEPQVINVHIK